MDAPAGWKNVDASPSLLISKVPIFGRVILALYRGPCWPKSVSYGDIVKGLKIKRETCELVFASHVLEHLTTNDVRIALENIHSYLKPNGIFRGVIPDLEKIINNYRSEKFDNNSKLDTACNFVKNTGLGGEQSRNNLRSRLIEAFSNSRHQWMYDWQSISGLLQQQGFKSIERREFGNWSDSRFKEVERSDRCIDAICFEARK